MGFNSLSIFSYHRLGIYYLKVKVEVFEAMQCNVKVSARKGIDLVDISQFKDKSECIRLYHE